MPIQQVPTDANGLPSYVQTTTLEGTQYILQFDYNQRCAAWYLSVADASNVDIYNGVKLVCGLPLLRKCKDPRRPPGVLLCVSTTSDSSPASLFDLVPGSGRCMLLYVTSDWVTLLADGQYAQIQAQLAAGVQASGLSLYGSQ